MIIVKIFGTFQDIGKFFGETHTLFTNWIPVLRWYMFELWTIQCDECIFHKVLLTDLVTDWLSDRTDYRDAIASKKFRKSENKNTHIAHNIEVDFIILGLLCFWETIIHPRSDVTEEKLYSQHNLLLIIMNKNDYPKIIINAVLKTQFLWLILPSVECTLNISF